MANTPFFPGWCRSRSFPRTLRSLGPCTLAQIEQRLARFVPTAAWQPRSTARPRPYSLTRTFWCFIWQMLQANASCREVVRQLQAAQALHTAVTLDDGTAAYCVARARLPLEALSQSVLDTAHAADRLSPPTEGLQGRRTLLVDATVLTLPDTPSLRAHYPQSTSQRPACGFPLLRVVVASSLRSGAFSYLTEGSYYQGEMQLFHRLVPKLHSEDIVIYDRAAGHYVAAAQLRARGIDLISLVSARLRARCSTGKVLSKNERLVTWPKSQKKPGYFSTHEWEQLPAQITMRVVRVLITDRNGRPKTIDLCTTLLDPLLYPAHALAEAMQKRWRLEMSLDDLKTTLRLDQLRCKTPALIWRELRAALIAHNVVRCLMAEAARTHAVALSRVSFKGTLDSFRHFSTALAAARTYYRRKKIWLLLLKTIASDLIPFRPGRREPRVVKRRPKAFPPLTRPRSHYRSSLFAPHSPSPSTSSG